ncbi:sigma-70 family RNA polymerase sigma factor [Corallococcus sp. bb12-1]|uniref:sigma-70 family RNA polymerase sigma factor n=1 Tax=Corallococcus sp. bb12-1 TaxID=2996784 RepID=UPI002271DDA6|nr:sigma-70 family RNA polymerase sigma factor [Corallococcus sp. bb12-1]MCY1045599.1 sigma-70 family RNA polymerase sigma factor [Corallococcus sp. bb12-1]
MRRRAAKGEARVSRNGTARSSPDELVSEIHGRHAAGEVSRARQLTDALLRLLEPQLRRQARTFEKLSGSLLEDDLVQVALIEALKAVGTYKPEKRGGQTFATWVEWRARRAIMDQIRMHSADVHPSDSAQRGRKGKAKTPRVPLLVSRDSPTESLPNSATQLHDAALALEVATVEELYAVQEECARLRREVLKLDPQLRELVSRVHGLGQKAHGVRQVAIEWNQPRSQLDVMLARAHEQLRERMEAKGR